MKRMKLFFMTFAVLSIAFNACTNINEPDDKNGNKDEVTTIYAEDFGTSAVQDGTLWPSLATYSGFNTTGKGSDSVSYTSEGGLVTVRSNSPSQGYTGVSGGSNVMAAAGGATLLVNDIAVCGATNLILSFGTNQTNTILAVSYKINGTSTWVPLTFTKDTENWGLVDSLVITLPATANTIKLKFVAGATQYGTRVDDIKLTTKDNTTAPVVDPDEGTDPDPTGNDPDPVTSLSEDFESYATSTGDAYFSTQTDNKGWFGFKIQGTLEPDMRTFSNNKYVQFSAHRTAITETLPQEFWLLSPRLDLTNAASKQISFEMSAGFFNAATEFELYIIDGNTPTATKTKLEGWRKPVAGDIVSGNYTPFISSGNINLSAYTGVKRIGFYYKGTSGSGNSTTYQLDNFIFGDVATMSVSPASLSFVRAGEAKTFTVTSNKTWTAESSDPTNFAVAVNDNTVTVTAIENTSGASRTATVTVTATDNSINRTVSLSQSGPSTGGNLVANGNFSAAWTSGIPTGWSVDAPANITITQGNGSFIVTNPTATTKFFQEIAVEAGATYDLSFKYASTHARFRIWSGFRTEPGGATITYLTSSNTTDPLRTNNLYFPVATTLTEKTYTFTVPAGQTIFLLEYRYYSQASSSTELKDVVLTKQ